MQRREFIKAAAMTGAAAVAPGCASFLSGGSTRWWKGQLHTHTLCSDAHAFPEEAVAVYRSRGYDFFAISDHNRAGLDRDLWREVRKENPDYRPLFTTEAALKRYRDAFGDKVETRTVNGKLEVRIRTFDEIAADLGSPKDFLLMPGIEVTDTLKSPYRHLHMNVINVPSGVPSRESKFYIYDQNRSDVAGLIADTFAEAKAQAAGRKFLFTVNHPHWMYWDVLPEEVMDNADVRFFELVNCDCELDFQRPDWLTLTLEQFWDVVNAHRCERGLPLLYANCADDTHTYFNPAKTQFGGAWLMVRSWRLDADALIDAMDAGYFYVSNGVELEEVAFDHREKRLTVAVKPENGVRYTIRFCVTKKNFSHQVEYRDLHIKDGFDRRLPIYPADTFGIVAKTVDGVAASYQMADDDLYVRAEVVSDRASALFTRRNQSIYYPKRQCAWIQPCR